MAAGQRRAVFLVDGQRARAVAVVALQVYKENPSALIETDYGDSPAVPPITVPCEWLKFESRSTLRSSLSFRGDIEPFIVRKY